MSWALAWLLALTLGIQGAHLISRSLGQF